MIFPRRQNFRRDETSVILDHFYAQLGKPFHAVERRNAGYYIVNVIHNLFEIYLRCAQRQAKLAGACVPMRGMRRRQQSF